MNRVSNELVAAHFAVAIGWMDAAIGYQLQRISEGNLMESVLAGERLRELRGRRKDLVRGYWQAAAQTRANVAPGTVPRRGYARYPIVTRGSPGAACC